MKQLHFLSLLKKKNKKDIEWPTLFLMFGVYTVYLLVSYYFQELPYWFVFIVAGYTLALFNSLQHEVIHHHPTASQKFNEALVLLPLNLFVPFELYKRSHLQHHHPKNLTKPEHDPESYYLPETYWNNLRPWQQQYYRGLNTLVGRMLWGPLHFSSLFLYTQAKKLLQRDYSHLRTWLTHLCLVTIVMMWVMGICGIGILEYLFFFVYPASSLTLMRSYLEHQSLEESAHRSAIVESHPLLSVLFLNNNLHAIHHDYPSMPWYRIGTYWRENRTRVLQKNAHYYYQGYWQIIKKYGLRCKESPAHQLRT